MRLTAVFNATMFSKVQGKNCPHKITTELATMGNNVNQMNHDLVNGFDIDCYQAFSSTRESLYVYEACNKLSVRLRKGVGRGGGGEDGRKEREDIHTRKTERRLLIGASLSEPHIDGTAGRFHIYYGTTITRMLWLVARSI